MKETSLPMNILMISAMFMPEVYGGAEQQTLKQAKALQKRGHNVTILTAKTQEGTLLEEDMSGVRVIRHNTYKQPDLLGRWIFFSFVWIFKTFLFAMKNKGQFDIVHCHQGKFGIFIGALISKIWSVPQLVKIGNSQEDLDIIALQKKKFVGPLFLNFALKNKPTFMSISKVIAQNLADFGIARKQVKVITNGVNTIESDFIQPDSKNIKFFWHGRFEAIKNLHLMIEGFSLALKENQNISLNLIGDGSLEQSLKIRSEELGIAHKVKFIKPPKDIHKTINEMDIFINTSNSEGMSNSMLEAMALGKAIISTPVSGTDEIIDNGKNGFIMKNHTDTEVVKAIQDVLKLTQTKNGFKAVFRYNKEKTESQFSIDSIAKKIEDLYKKL